MAKRVSRAERFEQVERFLASDMSAAEWCPLNGMSVPTLYRWLDRYAEAECPERAGELRPKRSKGGWIELCQADAKAAVAIVAATDAPGAPAAGAHDGQPAPRAVAATVAAATGAGPEPVTVSMAGATIEVTAATDPAALRLALETLAAL